jgi:hypothetical protein
MTVENTDIYTWNILYIWCDMQICSFVTDTNCNDPLTYVRYRGFLDVSETAGWQRSVLRCWLALGDCRVDQICCWCELDWVALLRLFSHTSILRRLFGKQVPSGHISRESSRLSLYACAVTSPINWEATDAISWNSCYVYVCYVR